ncbi:hypothetical protein HZZ16_35980 [Bradyrhizobium sp. CNPSo 4016]|nr:hypothetical protein [Bradyrhizobium glycinis]
MLYKALTATVRRARVARGAGRHERLLHDLDHIELLLLDHRGFEPIDAGAPCAAVRVH